MKILAVLGANGMLGFDLIKKAETEGWQVKKFDLPNFDITDSAHLKHAVDSTDCIVNCAAYTNVDKAEEEKDICEAVNATAPGMLGKLAAEAGKYVVQISTDFVYGDLKNEPQSENDSPNPLSVYGQSKLDGENKLLASGCECGIIRVQWSYGINGVNFITKLAGLAARLPKLKVVEDQSGAPTWTADMASAIQCFLRKRPQGVYNFAANGYATRFDTAQVIASELGLDVELTPCSSDEFPVVATRPHNSKFNCSKIDEVLDFTRPEWQDSLRVFLKKYRDRLV
jgi:dTDP-4-dehydrorhamnose reductase